MVGTHLYKVVLPAWLFSWFFCFGFIGGGFLRIFHSSNSSENYYQFDVGIISSSYILSEITHSYVFLRVAFYNMIPFFF